MLNESMLQMNNEYSLLSVVTIEIVNTI